MKTDIGKQNLKLTGNVCWSRVEETADHNVKKIGKISEKRLHENTDGSQLDNWMSSLSPEIRGI